MLRETITLVNQKLLWFGEHVFIAHNFAQLFDQAVGHFVLFRADCHYRSITIINAMIHYATACQNPERQRPDHRKTVGVIGVVCASFLNWALDPVAIALGSDTLI